MYRCPKCGTGFTTLRDLLTHFHMNKESCGSHALREIAGVPFSTMNMWVLVMDAINGDVDKWL
jgi:hypothetical protein